MPHLNFSFQNNVIVVKILLYQNLNHFPNHTQIYNVNTYHHKSGKKRFILDLSILNLSIKKEKVKFEDWKIAVQYFERDAFMFKFDLKSDYFVACRCKTFSTKPLDFSR
jgi:hypothetical protein